MTAFSPGSHRACRCPSRRRTAARWMPAVAMGARRTFAGDDDAFQGLARRDLEVLVVHEGEVLVWGEAPALAGFLARPSCA